jgi:nitrate/nitrite transporter NarK
MKDRWLHRRRMAYASMIGGLLFPLLVLYTSSDQLGAIAGAFYVFVSAVVGAYVGFAALDDKWQKESDRDDF